MFKSFLLSLLSLGACLVVSCSESDSDDTDTNSSEQCETDTNTDAGTDKCECDTQDTGDPTTDDTTDDEGPLSKMAYDALFSTGMFVEEAEIFTTTYHEGYNLNFKITEAEAASLLPDNLAPLSLKLLDSDPEPNYYLTWYLAVLDLENELMPMTRIDLFTYATNEEGEMTLYFISSYMSIPPYIMDDDFMFGMIEEIFEFFARDSKTGKPAYPHYYTETLTADSDTFKLTYEGASIEATACEPLTTEETFSREFIMANSQIYRNAYDRNVNYFNQSFMSAKVQTRDLSCVKKNSIEGFHSLLGDLESIHFYGSKDKGITWYYETCENNVCESLF